jgi:signal transduction histidine kinase
MKNKKYAQAFSAFKERYSLLLENFLKDEKASEVYLNEGYQIGRQAILNNYSVLSIAAIHHDSLINFLQQLENNANHVNIADKATILLEEVLAPSAMLSKEYFREAIILLNKRSVEFAVRIRGLQEEIIRRKRIEEETTRTKSEFLANMSHELRTPLNAIIGFTELIYSEKVGPISPDHKEYMGDILSSGRHLLQLINEILDLTKIDAGKMEFFPELINLNDLISEVSESLGSLITEKKLKLEIKTDPLLKYIVIDPIKLRQILYNYLSNAIKFSDHGKITISTHALPEGYFRIEVKDSGIGISKENINQLFVAFQQLDVSIAKKYQGTGLGLALTRSIVEAQGGTVGVTSAIGKGSTFFAVLPCTPLHNDSQTPYQNAETSI